MKEAGIMDVVRKITRRVRDTETAERLVDKVTRFVRTGDPSDDLTRQEVSMVYGPEDYGDDFDMPAGKELDVGWTDHAEYRSDLRDVDPSRMNEAVRDFAEAHPGARDRRKVKLVKPGVGKAVVDMDATGNPEDAAVVTVFASDDGVLAALREMGVRGLSKVVGEEDIRWQAVFLIGAAGAGKSWYRTKKYLVHLNFKLVDPDEVKKSHPDYDPERPYILHEWSKDVSDGEYRKVVTNGNGDPVVVDGTGRDASGIASKIGMARANGYRTFLVYVWVPVEVSLFRNRNRDRFVPEKKLVEAYYEIQKSFTFLKGAVDRYKVVSNYESSDLSAAKADVAVYPPPQAVRPPRPGDADYGLARAASVSRRVRA